MDQPDFDGAIRYAYTKLTGELPAYLIYHSAAHSHAEVASVSAILAQELGVTAADQRLLRTAAIFHDIGFIEQTQGRELVGMRVVSEVLPAFNFTAAQIAQIQGMIMATRLPQVANNLLEAIIADADLDVLGREDFWVRNAALRSEMASCGQSFSDAEWYTNQLRFLSTHRYFTAAARARREQGKQRHIVELAERLAACR